MKLKIRSPSSSHWNEDCQHVLRIFCFRDCFLGGRTVICFTAVLNRSILTINKRNIVSLFVCFHSSGCQHRLKFPGWPGRKWYDHITKSVGVITIIYAFLLHYFTTPEFMPTLSIKFFKASPVWHIVRLLPGSPGAGWSGKPDAIKWTLVVLLQQSLWLGPWWPGFLRHTTGTRDLLH